MAIQGFFTGDVKIRDLNGVLKAVNGIVEVATDAGTVTSVGIQVGSTGTDVNVANSPVTTSGNITLNLPTASATNRGLLSSTDWAIFDAKQGTITLTTIGSSGPATLTSGTLNIPNYGEALSGYVTLGTTQTITGQKTFNTNTLQLAINGTSQKTVVSNSPIDSGSYSLGVNFLGFNASNNLYFSKSGDNNGIFAFNNSQTRIYTLQNASGTLAFTSDIPSLTFSAPLVNTAGVVSIPAATGSVNGYLTSTDWTTFNSKQNTLTLTTTGSSGASTLVGATLNIPTYTLSGLGGVPTSRQLTINGTAYDLSADRSWSVGTVTSVGLTMPSAFVVSSSPVTGSGTISVTGAGNATQYIRGDGALATFPTNGGGGGASVSYYLNGSVNQGTFGGNTYYEMNKTPIIGAGTDFTINADGYIAQFITDANDPALLKIPAGNWNFETYFQASSGGGSPTFYIELYKYNGTTFTLIASNSGNPKLINDGTNIEAYFTALAVPETVLTLTDRIAIRIYVTHSGRTITLHTENSHLCQVITTFTTGLAALNGLTEQVQYLATGTSGTDFNISSVTATHTFNLPTASATNRGALSTADWTRFNSNIPAGTPATGDYVFYNGSNLAYRGLVANAPLSYNSTTATFSISQASGSTNGFLSSTDWTTFNSKQNALTLTTTGSSGSSTLVGATLNVPTYTLSGLGGVPTSRQLTINGTAYDLSADRSWSVGTLTGTLTTNFVPKATGATSLADSLIYDNGSGVGINTTSPYDSSNFKLDVNGGVLIKSTSGTLAQLILINSNPATGGNNGFVQFTAGGNTATAFAELQSYYGISIASGALRLQPAGGQVLIGTRTTSAFLTDINGTLRVSGQLTLGSTITDGTNTYTLPSSTGTLALVGGSGVGTVTSVAALTIGTTGTDLSSTVANGTTTPVITLNVPTASATNRGALSSADWTTFNNKQNTLTNPVTGTGTTNYLPKFTGTSTIGNSQIFDNGTNVGINQPSPTRTLDILGASGIGTVLKLQGASGTTTYLQLAYNGATDAQSGYIGYNSSSQMQFFTNNTLAATINASGNLGLGVTPSAWVAGISVIDIGARGTVYTGSVSNGSAYNAYVGSLGWQYKQSAEASRYEQNSGTHAWYIAPSGTAGNAISFTQAMTLDASGRLGIGVTSPTTFLDINSGTNPPIIKLTSSAVGQIPFSIRANIPGFSNSGFSIYDETAAASRLVISSTGNVGIGTNNLSAYGSQRFLVVGNGAASQVARFTDGSNADLFFDFPSAGISRITAQYGTTGTLVFAKGTGSVETMRITSDGNVGIGTTAPQTGVILDIRGAGAVAGGSEGLRIGNVGDNSAYDNVKLWYTGFNGGAPRVYLTPRTTPGSGVINTFFHLQNTNGTSTVSNNTMGLIVDGNVGIGTASPNYPLEASLPSGSNGQIIRMNRSAGAYAWGIGIDGANSNFHFYNNGGTSVANINNSTGAYTATSDQRLKENILYSQAALDKVLQLKVRQYDWKNSGIKESYGFIAQELFDVLPQYVSKGNDTTNWGVAKAELVPMLVKAIQELKAELDTLKNK